MAAGGAAELTARCRQGEKAIGASWTNFWGNVRDLYVFADEGRVAVVFDNTSTIDVAPQLRAVCLSR